MRKLNYSKLIKEDIKTLKQVQAKLKYAYQRKVIQLLILLKSGKCNLHQAAQLMSIGYRSARRYWKFYNQNGLEGVKNWKDTRKKYEKLSDKEVIDLVAKHQPSTLREAVEIIKKEKGVVYSIQGLHSKFRRLKIRLKTGRPSHEKKILLR